MARQSVESFYKAYIAEVKAFTDRPREPARKDPKMPADKWDGHFTKAFRKVYRKMSADPDLDYDLLLQSNNVPDELKSRRIRMEGAFAYISLEYVGYIPETPLLEVRLKKEHGVWLIDAVGNVNKTAGSRRRS